jgi:bifunctional oligoribonuclease and PAP phosphatase NrnA
VPTPLESLVQSLQSARRVLLSTHVRPDGDALGTTAAVQLALRQRGIDSEILLLSKLPTKYAFLFRELGIVYRSTDDGPVDAAWLQTFDRLFVMDTGTWSQLPGLDEICKTWKVETVVMDHHSTQEPWGQVRWVDTKASAAGEMACELISKLGAKVDASIATALFVAIASDTGWFAFSNTSPLTMRRCADLMDVGVDTDRIYQLLFQNERPERLLLQQCAMKSLEFLAGGRVTRMVVRKSDFEKTGANVPDTENLVNIPLQVASVQVSVLINEDLAGGPVRVSFRSKGQLDVARFAEQFGGGGHVRASGAKFNLPVDEVIAKVSKALEDRMDGPH